METTSVEAFIKIQYLGIMEGNLFTLLNLRSFVQAGL